MAPVTSSNERNERPTLPPLHTLGLPVPLMRQPRVPGVYEPHDRQTCPLPTLPQSYIHARQVSTSSSATSSSPSPSPSPSPLDHPSRHLTHSLADTPLKMATSGRKFRLVPTTLDTADAIIVVPPPNSPLTTATRPRQPAAASPIESTRNGQALLLVGPALQNFRHSQRPLTKGARIHPYRIVKSVDDRRRHSSVISTMSS